MTAPKKPMASTKPKVKGAQKVGRPSSYTEVTADAICEMIASGTSLLTICALPVMPEARTVYRWLEDNEEFRHKYARARERQADLYASQIIEIADTARPDETDLARIRIDARKWTSGKLAPKKYSDKLMQEITGRDGGPIAATLAVSKIEYEIIDPAANQSPEGIQAPTGTGPL